MSGKTNNATFIRVISLVVALLLMFSLVACGNDSVEADFSAEKNMNPEKGSSDKEENSQLHIQPANQNVICMTEFGTYAINVDGSVRSTNLDSAGEDVVGVEDWTDVCSLYATSEYLFALRNDGTVIGSGKVDLSSWTNIVNISVSSSHVVGLRRDGTVCAEALLPKYEAACDVDQWENVVSISTGVGHTVGLKQDGTVVAVGYEGKGACNVSEWKNVKAIATGDSFTVGLLEDGTVVSTEIYVKSGNVMLSDKEGKLEISTWHDIASIYASGSYVIGVKTDGSAVSAVQQIREVGQEYPEETIADFSAWTDLAAVSVSPSFAVGLKKDGTVVANEMYKQYLPLKLPNWNRVVIPYAGSTIGPYVAVLTEDGSAKAFGFLNCNIYHWERLLVPDGVEFTESMEDSRFKTMTPRVKRNTVAANESHIVAVKKDGTAIAEGNDSYGQIDVAEWTDLIAVGVGANHTVGLRNDGTVVAVGDNSFGQCDVSQWQNITNIAVEANHTIGVRSDGTVVAVGENSQGQCDVDGWTDVVDVYTGFCYTVGLKEDGTGVAAGKVYVPGIDEPVALDVSDWKNVVTYSNNAWGDVPAILYSDGTAEIKEYVGSDSDSSVITRRYHYIVDIGVNLGFRLVLRNDGTLDSPHSHTNSMRVFFTDAVCVYTHSGNSGGVFVLDSSGNLYDNTEFKWESIMIPDWCYEVFDLQ